MRTFKIVFIISLIAVVGFINLSDTSASENSGVAKMTISKDTEPLITPVNYSDLGVMTASWYGPHFHGKSTANGESYNQMALTAAHKSLPFGTLLKVTNLRNGRAVIVRINDRGPYFQGRDLDLSKGTSLSLGMLGRGVIRVKVQEVLINSGENPVNTLN